MLDALVDATLSWGRWLAITTVFFALVFHFRRSIPWRSFSFEVALIIGAYFTYFAVRGLTEGSYDRALSHANDVIALERSLSLDFEPWLQATVVQTEWIRTAANWVYVWGHWPVIVITASYLLIKTPGQYRLYRNAFLFSGAIGVCIFALFPVAPPRLVPDFGMLDTVTEHSNAYRVLQPSAFTNQYAAVPSLHFGWNLIVGIALFRLAGSPLSKALAVALPVLMGLSIVITANHYIVDAVAGGAVALIGLWLATRLASRSAEPQTETQPAVSPIPGWLQPPAATVARPVLTLTIPQDLVGPLRVASARRAADSAAKLDAPAGGE